MTFAKRFLHVPDLFPARRSGHRWGTTDLCVDFAGGPYVFRGLSDCQAAILEDRYQDLDCGETDESNVVEILVFKADAGDFREPEPIPARPYAMDLDCRPASVRIAAESLMGLLFLSPLRAALWTSVETPTPQVIAVFENFFRLVVAYRLNQLGGVLLHSAGVLRESRAYLFLGRSGAGKTTISRICQAAGLEVLSDDMNAVLPAAGGAVVEKLPFAGDLGQTGKRVGGGDLAALFRLEQAPEHTLKPLAEPEAVALLVSCSPYLNADPHRTDRLLHNARYLLRGCTANALAFRPDPDFWKLLEDSP